MKCLWKPIKFSVIMWDSENGTKMYIKICVARLYIYSRTDHKKNQIPLEECSPQCCKSHQYVCIRSHNH